MTTEGPALLLAHRRQRDIGAAGVPATLAPFRLTVTYEPDAMMLGHERRSYVENMPTAAAVMTTAVVQPSRAVFSDRNVMMPIMPRRQDRVRETDTIRAQRA